jgi:hypothetical protein
MAVPWLKRLVAGLSPRRSGFAHGSINVGYVVEKVALGQVISEIFGFPLSISVHRRPPYSYLLGDEQYVRQWQQSKDVVSPHRTLRSTET